TRRNRSGERRGARALPSSPHRAPGRGRRLRGPGDRGRGRRSRACHRARRPVGPEARGGNGPLRLLVLPCQRRGHETMRTTKKTESRKAHSPRPSTKGVAAKPAAAAEVPAGELPTVAFADPRAFSTWLAANHATSRGVWLRLAKKASGIPSVTYAEAIDVAL